MKKKNKIKKYFGLPGKRKRYRRAHQVRGLPSLEEQLHHVDDQDGPREYTLVKERKQPRSAPKDGRTKRPKKRGADRRCAGHRMIIDIHLEVLDECQKGDMHSTKEDFLEILVQEFMRCEFTKEENVPEEQVSMVPSSDSGFRVNVPKEDASEEQVQCSCLTFSEEDFVPKEEVSKEDVLKEDIPKESVPREEVPSSRFML
ncbi:SICA antigen [Plasmodium coatneyi]|uniref:SICA antigen n=1 Tax=Plasmodium coatneyi TaxID=208452 RepID=A0A1B1E110_9APIC|nr:SICA antigen [Plasmodium coatneyi]ANQ08565.1 SICA antigen [Plasmodium coatneyi]